MINIKKISLAEVLENDKILYNVNNIKPIPEDYHEKINKGNTKNWIDLFHKNNYRTIILDKKDLKWMYKAFIIGSQTGRFSHMFEDSLDETCKKYRNTIIKNNFVRTEKVSLKEGMFGIGPYNSLEDIIKSMCTSKFGHVCFLEDDLECKIYLMNWVDIIPDNEFRIFVYNNKITCISNQHLYRENVWLSSLEDDIIKTNVVKKILVYFDSNIKEKMSYMGEYSMDLALIKIRDEIGDQDDTPYFIEPNSFGGNYASGSSLFHWVIDHNIMYGKTNSLEFRFTYK